MFPRRAGQFSDSLSSAAHSHHSCESHGSDAVSSFPSPTTTIATATEAGNLTGDVASMVHPVVARGQATAAVAGTLMSEETGLDNIDAVTETTTLRAAFCIDPEKVCEYRKAIKRFRILVMGRGNAGKTTVLHRVCNSTDEPEIFDGNGNKIDNAVVQGNLPRGYHFIEDELVFRSNPGFVFHDSVGFEAGSTESFDKMRRFVDDCAGARTPEKHVHAIWYCIPMTDCHRPVTVDEEKFFNECDIRHVPVVVLLTKVDALQIDAMQELEDEGLGEEGVEERVMERVSQLLDKHQVHIKQRLEQCKFPPKVYMPLKNMHEESADISALLQCTESVLNEIAMPRMLISTHQSITAYSIQHAMYWVVERTMLRAISRQERPDMKAFQFNILCWFPKHKIQCGIEDQSNVPSQYITEFIAEHGVACMLFFEHCYIILHSLQIHKEKDVITVAAQEYKSMITA
ncbi:hypothetical protein EDD15DRAFT_2302252 [Pisolithus albus]|nr:hypothetical protein EDD15DRAFT_2302252 [Pisolithus albus]